MDKDISDPQYRQFRQGLPPLAAVSVLYIACSFIFDRATRNASKTVDKLQYFVVPFALVFLFILHGLSAFKILIILACNYRLARKYAGQPKWGAAIGWAFNVLILVANKRYNGYMFKSIHSTLAFLVKSL